jgi:hypothetical protein
MFATLLQFHYKLKIPSQMYPEVTSSVHWDLKRYHQNKTHIATAQNHSHERLNENSVRNNMISFCRVNSQTRNWLQDLTAVWSNKRAPNFFMQHNEKSWIHRLQYEGKSIWAVTGLLKTDIYQLHRIPFILKLIICESAFHNDMHSWVRTWNEAYQ